jgi:hypothetical protein
MTYAQILNNIVQNVIVLDNASLASMFAVGFDACIRIDNITDVDGNSIGIGWTTPDNINFTPPVESQ